MQSFLVLPMNSWILRKYAIMFYARNMQKWTTPTEIIVIRTYAQL